MSARTGVTVSGPMYLMSDPITPEQPSTTCITDATINPPEACTEKSDTSDSDDLDTASALSINNTAYFNYLSPYLHNRGISFSKIVGYLQLAI